MKSSTIAWVKRHAKKLKKERQIPHHVALDLAAKESGFVNWKHLLNSSDDASPVPAIHQKNVRPGPVMVAFQTILGTKYVRPNAKMPIEGHKQVAALLDQVLAATHLRKSVCSPIGLVRSELDEWVQKEYTRIEMPDAVFHDLYYAHRNRLQDRKSISREEAEELTRKLESVKEILARHYPDCKPMAWLFGKLDQAITALGKWAGGPPGSSVRRKQLKRGTAIRVKPFKCDAVVIEHDTRSDTVRHFSDSGLGLVARHEVSVCQDQAKAKRKPMRLYLPYGKWSCADGSEVLFNRDYKPMWVRSKTGAVTAIEPNTWVKFEKQTYYYEEHNPPWSEKKTLAVCTAVLEEWGVSERTPSTMGHYSELLRTGIEAAATKFEHEFPAVMN